MTLPFGLVIVGALLYPGVQLNPSEAQTKDQPAAATRSPAATALTAAGISAGAICRSRFSSSRATSRRRQLAVDRETRRGDTDGVLGAVGTAAVAQGRRGDRRGLPSADGNSSTRRPDDLAAPAQHAAHGSRPRPGYASTLGGAAAENQDFVHAVYGNFPYVLLSSCS